MDSNFLHLFGIIISLLLSVVAYFVKQLHTDFRGMFADLSDVKNNLNLIKAENRGGYDLLQQKVQFIDDRLSNIEKRRTTKGEPHSG
jgi:hypothetical protein